jgi:glycosyltransferase involved in cell wall biosynthesis
MNPLISVVIPTYNWSDVLKISIKSVLWQTYQNFEIIVIGDACTDDSELIVKSFNDPRIKWFNLQENSGSQSAPNNFGIKKSKGEWIAHLGHDDVWHPNHLEFLLKCSDNSDFCYSAGCYIGPDNEETEFKNKFILFGLASFQKNMENGFHIPPSCIMYKKYIYEKIGEWKDYKELHKPPDIEFILRGLRFCENKINITKRATVFKFNSAWRKNSYILKPNHQQLEFVKKIENNINFLDSTLIKTAKQINPFISSIEEAYLALEDDINKKLNEINKNSIFKNFEPLKEKGFYVKQARIYRGLDKE